MTPWIYLHTNIYSFRRGCLPKHLHDIADARGPSDPDQAIYQPILIIIDIHHLASNTKSLSVPWTRDYSLHSSAAERQLCLTQRILRTTHCPGLERRIRTDTKLTQEALLRMIRLHIFDSRDHYLRTRMSELRQYPLPD